MNLLLPALGVGAAYFLLAKDEKAKPSGAVTYSEQEVSDMMAQGCYEDPPGSGGFV
jgi:hypothetical protein